MLDGQAMALFFGVDLAAVNALPMEDGTSPIPREWVRRGKRRASEARAHTGSSELIDAMEFWATARPRRHPRGGLQMTAERDWWDACPAARRMEIRRAVWKYLGHSCDVPDFDTLNEVLHWSKLENDVLEAHSAWLSNAKATVEAACWPWTVAEMVRYEQEHPE